MPAAVVHELAVVVRRFFLEQAHGCAAPGLADAAAGVAVEHVAGGIECELVDGLKKITKRIAEGQAEEDVVLDRVDDEEIVFEEPKPLSKEDACMRILLQVKDVFKTNKSSMSALYQSVSISFDPFMFKVVKKPTEVVI